MKKKGNTAQYILLGIIVITGIFLCAMLVAIGNDNPKRKTVKNKTTTAASQASTAAIVNLPSESTLVHEGELAVVTSVNAPGNTLGVYFTEDLANETFILSEGTYIYSKYGTAMALSQVEAGDVVELTYDEISGKVTLVQYPENIKKFGSAEGVFFNPSSHVVSLYNDIYQYSDDIVIASGDRLLKPSELDLKDQLSLFIKDSKIISVKVEKGHGYLSLTGYDLFLGGFLDVGNYMIKTVEKDMMLVVKEGTYQIRISHNGYVGTKTVEILRDQVATVDFSEITAATIEKGNVLFDINVSDAKLYLNGELTDYEIGVLTLPVGSYSVKVVADGFETYTDNIDVITDYQKVNIKMVSEEKESTPAQSSAAGEKATNEKGSDENTSDESASLETESSTYVSAKNKVFIDDPEGAAIYFDGTYLGVAPLEMRMVTGSHVFIVVDGSDVRSYTVNLADGADDVRYSFN